jgi:hypothetical protein
MKLTRSRSARLAGRLHNSCSTQRERLGRSAAWVDTLDNLPAGDYVVSGQVGASATVGDAAGDEQDTSFSILFGARITSGGTSMGLKCYRAAGSGAAGTGPNPSVVYSDFIATKVGSLTQQ